MPRLILILALGGTLAPPIQAKTKSKLKSYVVHSTTAPTYSIGKNRALVKMLFNKHNGHLAASMQHLTAKAGLVIPPHRHPKSTELLYIISGNATMFMTSPDGKKREFAVSEGLAIWIPAGWLHGLTMPAKGKALNALQLYLPGGPEQRFTKGRKLSPKR